MKFKIIKKLLFFCIVFYILCLPITLVLLATFPCLDTVIMLLVNICSLHLLYYVTKELL